MRASPRINRRSLLALDLPTPAPLAGHWIRVHRIAMACRFEITLPGEDARHLALARAGLDEIDRIEAALTVFRDTSELARVNRSAAAGAVSVDRSLFSLLTLCRELHDRTDGAFDITSTPLSRCWGFIRREGRLPSVEEIAQARACVAMTGVELDEAQGTVRFARPGMELNLGSIGKGYALGVVGGQMQRKGVKHALLSAGTSSVLALGDAGTGWVIDIRSRQVSSGRVARVRLRHAAMATSGAGEQFVEIDGVRYGHVIDPRTGWPASGVVSATVINDDPAKADALSTACLIGGMDLAQRYSNAHPGTLIILRLADPNRSRLLGGYDGAVVEELW